MFGDLSQGRILPVCGKFRRKKSPYTVSQLCTARAVLVAGIHHHHGLAVGPSPGQIDESAPDIFEADVVFVVDHGPHGRLFEDLEDALPLARDDRGVLAPVFAGTDADDRDLLDEDAIGAVAFRRGSDWQCHKHHRHHRKTPTERAPDPRWHPFRRNQ